MQSWTRKPPQTETRMHVSPIAKGKHVVMMDAELHAELVRTAKTVMMVFVQRSNAFLIAPGSLVGMTDVGEVVVPVRPTKVVRTESARPHLAPRIVQTVNVETMDAGIPADPVVPDTNANPEYVNTTSVQQTRALFLLKIRALPSAQGERHAIRIQTA